MSEQDTEVNDRPEADGQVESSLHDGGDAVDYDWSVPHLFTTDQLERIERLRAFGHDLRRPLADSLRDRVIRYSADGMFIEEIGSTGRAPGQLSSPLDVAVRSGGSFLVADTGNNRIQQFDSDGSLLTAWGRFGRADGEFDSPRSVAPRGSDDVFVADAQNNRIQTFRCE